MGQTSISKGNSYMETMVWKVTKDSKSTSYSMATKDNEASKSKESKDDA